MFDPILVPLDGSLLAESVLPHAIALGQAFKAKIVLVHALEKHGAGASAQLFDLLSWQINKTEARLYLERIRDRLRESGLQAQAFVLEGPVADAITEYSQTQEMKLVILSSHGQSGFGKWGISSVTHKIILSAPTSVFIVRAPRQQDQPYGRILVPLDGSRRAENVLPMVTLLARYFRSQLQIVHVVTTPEMARQMPPIQEDVELSNRLVARNREEALHYLDQVKLRSSLAGIDVQSRLLVSNNASVALHELVDREQIDLVALSAHGFSGNNQWPYGSMVDNFILYGKVPLLIVQDLPVRDEASQADVTMREHLEH